MSSSLRSVRAMTIVRRVHLYAGLLLVPWLLLYGVTALMFNHPGLTGAPAPVVELGADDATAIHDATPDIDATAASIVAALRTSHPDRTIELGAARWRGVMRAEGHDGDRPLRLSVAPDTATGAFRPQRDPPPSPEGMSHEVELPDAGIDATAFGPMLDAVVAAKLTEPSQWQVRGTPVVELALEIDGAPWIGEYDLRGRSLELVDPTQPDVPRALMRLHMTHGYPDIVGVPWLHAVIVDAVAICILMWALSGLAMWWQLRRLRAIGASVVIAGSMLAVGVLTSVWADVAR